MNISLNIRKETKLVKKIRWYTYKITTTLASNYAILQNLVTNKSLDIAICQNDKIYELSHLNINEY